MRSPAKRPLAFVAEYQFGDDNLLTATHHEEMRLKNEERVRNAKSILKLEGLTLGGETSPTHNMKRIQQEQDRHDEIDQHNLILLQRLERIHHHVPKQFDVSHHSEAVQNAPRASNAGLRRRQQDKIELENKRMKRRLTHMKGTFDLKKLATDAERHHYFSDQLSKVGRRRKVQETCKHLSEASVMKGTESHRQQPEQFYVYQHQAQNAKAAPTHRDHAAYEDDEEGDDEDAQYDTPGSDGRRDRQRDPQERSWRLPPVHHSSARKYVQNPSHSPTVTNTAKAISAADLLHGFKSF